MELKRDEDKGLRAMAAKWAATPDTELEAMVPDLDLTSWQDIVQYLRRLGFTESQRDIKLNICIDKTPEVKDLRLTIQGEDAIQAYCRDDTPVNYTAMIKEPVEGVAPITLSGYGTRIKLKREIALADDARVKSVISRWPTVPKYFRQIQRYEFSRQDIGMRFDLSVIRAGEGTTFAKARISEQVARYEAEVELTGTRESPDAAFRLICRGLGLLLQGRQRSFVLISKMGAANVVAALKSRFGAKFPGPQPVTLQKKNLDTIRTYNVTDKADGLRCLLCVLGGNVYLVDAGFQVYATGLTSDADVVLDGEWIRGSSNNYYAFDCLTDGPFRANAGGRWAAMRDAVAAIKPNEKIPAHEALVVSMKEFRMGPNAVAETLDAVRPYKTDGLIFTPDDAPLPGGGTWDAQFKWKPAHENTIDFLVVIEPRRVDGAPQKDDLVETGEHHGHMVSYKTLGLFVGKSLGGNWKPAPFTKSPIAYVALGEGNEIYTTAHEVIHTNTIVEMAYDMESKEPEAWRWIPMRIRHDKTSRYRANQKGSTMNAEHVALSNWNSIHDPVTEAMIRGVVPSVIPIETPVIPLTKVKKSKKATATTAAPEAPEATVKKSRKKTAVPEAVPVPASEAVPVPASEAAPVPASEAAPVSEAAPAPASEAAPEPKKSKKKTVAPTAAPIQNQTFLVNAKQETSTALESGWSKYLAVTAKFPITDDGNTFDSVQAAVASRKADFPADAWKPEQYRLYQLYLKQRYDNDVKFRAMIDAIKATNGTILYANGSAKEQDLGVGVVNGEVVGGQNLLGSWMLALS